VITLKAECGLLIAGNPETGFFDREKGFAVQINLPPALWSRIDLLFIVLDDPDRNKDTLISDHILRNHRVGGMIQNREHSKNPMFTDSEIQDAKKEIEAPISEDLLRMYIAYARMYIYPVTSKEVSDYITSFYVDVRSLKQLNPNNPVPITARSVEAVQRLAEAHARMRLSETVTFADVDAAKRIIRVSLEEVGMDENGTLDAGIIYCGKSKSQQEKISILVNVIKSEKFEESIFAKMKSHGVEAPEVHGMLKELLERGKVWKTGDEYRNV
ncbi:MAG: hypothetical protein PHG64_14075, partial [Paludibacter sp.]|nr:hypothetical protein [Paludibacter sp.]